MTDDWRTGYRQAVVSFLRKNGTFVLLEAYQDGWTDEPSDDYDQHRTTYSWADHGHRMGERWSSPPIEGCAVVSVDLDSMREQSLSQFTDTFHSNEMKAGVEVRATCACGMYSNKWLRWEGTLGEILPELLKEEM